MTRRLAMLAAALALWPIVAHPAPLPERANRVVAIDWGIAETLLAIGAPLVGLAETGGYREWVSEPSLPPAVADIGLRSTPNLDYVAALDPDVILSTPQFAAIEPILSQVAPLLVLETYTGALEPYRNAVAVTRRLGELVDREAEAERLVADTDARVGRLSDTLKTAPRRKALIVVFHDDTHVWIFTEGSLYDDVLERAGIENAWTGSVNFWGIANATVDQLAGIDAAMLIVEPVPLSIRRKLEGAEGKDSLLRQMPLFQHGGFRILPPAWGFGALPSAGRFADALLAHADFLTGGDAD